MIYLILILHWFTNLKETSCCSASNIQFSHIFTSPQIFSLLDILCMDSHVTI